MSRPEALRTAGARRLRRWRGLLLPLAFFVCLEVLARLVTPTPAYMENRPYDPDLGFRSSPDLSVRITDERGEFPFRLSSDGFRGPELSEAWAEDRASQRVLFVGDSFLIGWMVREASLMSASTGTALEERGLPTRTASIAGDGYGTAQELILLRRHLSRLRPDVVVLCFFAGNDVADNSIDLIGRTRVSPGAYVRPYLIPEADGDLRSTWLHPWRARLRRLSRVAQLVELRLLGLGWIDSHERAPQALLTDFERVEAGLLPRAYLNLFVPSPEAPWDAAWASSIELLGHFRDEVRAHGARLLVAVIPHKLQVQRDAEYDSLEARVAAAGLEPVDPRLDWNLPEKRLAESLGAAGIQTVFLLEPLRRETERTVRSMYQHDGHLNGLGHQVAGQAIATALTVSPGADRALFASEDAAPVDLPDLVLGQASRFDFASEPHPELFGRGWHGWAADWWDAVPGWAMSGRGEVLVPNRVGTLILRGWLPEAAEVPARLRIDGVVHTIRASGHFTVRHRLRSVETSSSSRRIVLRLRSAVPLWKDARGRRCGLVLESMELRQHQKGGGSQR